MKSILTLMILSLRISLLFLSYGSLYTYAYAEASLTEVQDVPPHQLSKLIQEHKANGNITLVFVYGSWCPVCQRNFPQLQQLAKQYQNENLDILAFSVDQDKDKLLHYLNKQFPIFFPSYRLYSVDYEEVKKAFFNAGITYNHTIPFIAVFDRQGTLVGEGNYSVASTAKVVQYLLSKHNQTR